MIADHQSKQRFDTISDMAADITDLKQQLTAMTIERDTQQIRAVMAERQVRQLEAQLTHPKKEVTTLVHEIQASELRAKADRELADHINAGWGIEAHSTFLVDLGQSPRYVRVLTLMRTAPLPAEPQLTEGHAAAVVANTATTVQESLTVADPAPAPAALAVTRKTVAPSAIVISEPAAPERSLSALAVKPVSASEAAFQADLNTALLEKAEEIKRTNPFYGYQPRSFRSMMEAGNQP